MKHILRTLTLFGTLCLLLFTQSHADSDLAINNERMHNIVRTMLDFKVNPRTLHPQNSAEDAPKFMLDLYERYQNRPITRGHRVGNTVRSIKATKEYVNKEEMYVFNLSSLSSTEKIISAEIHLYKNKKTKFNKQADLELVLHEIASQYIFESGKVSVKKELYGWQWFDITDSVKKCIVDRQTDPPSLGLNFKVIKPHGNSNVLQLKRFINEHSVPLLIVYSVESQNSDLDELEKLTERRKEQEVPTTLQIDNKKDVALPVTDTTLVVRAKRNKRSISDNGVGIPAYQSQARSLSLLTNEIPEYPDDYNRLYPIHVKTIQTHPAMLQTRKVSRHRLVDSKLIPYPGEYTENKKKNRLLNKRRKINKRRNNNTLVLPKEWEDLQHMVEEEHNSNTCSKKKLTVDFNDIGWGEWIISPKSFKAHYCSGSCPFPLTKKLRPSNHATIQSLVNAVGINPEVPAPCCVPDKLSSITLLYFDENRNVVLKNYPNMTVRKCACR